MVEHREIVIAPNQGKKGRSFQATCLTTVESSLWEGGTTKTDNVRPVLAAFAGTDQELRAFMTNLTLGRLAAFPVRSTSYRKKEDRLEVLKSARFRMYWQREAEGTVATVYLPELFDLDPGMVDPSGARFILMPSQAWCDRQQLDTRAPVQYVRKLLQNSAHKDEEMLSPEGLAALVPVSYLFAAYLDRRTRCPILQDSRFYLQLLVVCLFEGLASRPNRDSHYRDASFGVHSRHGFRVEREGALGYAPGISFSAKHEEIERVLAEQTTIFRGRT